MATTTYLKARYSELLKNIPKAQKETSAWFRDAQNVVSGRSFMSRGGAIGRGHHGQTRLRPNRRMTQSMIGRLVMYFYDPKLKDKKRKDGSWVLPYYDRFPLVIPLEIYTGKGQGWLGLNLHYLNPKMRVNLLDSLYEIYDDHHLNERNRLQLSYETVKSITGVKYYRPALKRYLSNHVSSKIYVVDPSEWDLTLLLPTERFVRASKYKVWKESRQIILGR